MTVNKLIKLLQTAPPNARVVIDIHSLKQIIPEWNLINLQKAEHQIIEKSDDDGGTKFRKNGEAATESVFILSGDHDWEREFELENAQKRENNES